MKHSCPSCGCDLRVTGGGMIRDMTYTYYSCDRCGSQWRLNVGTDSEEYIQIREAIYRSS